MLLIFVDFKSIVISSILSTDMARHNEFINTVHNRAATTFNYPLLDIPEKRQDDVLLLGSVLIKSADICNPSRPFKIAAIWSDVLLTEFFNQGDLELKNGLPFGLYNDRKTVNKAKSQVDFISHVTLPWFETASKLVSAFDVNISNLQINLKIWNINVHAQSIISDITKEVKRRKSFPALNNVQIPAFQYHKTVIKSAIKNRRNSWCIADATFLC